MSCIRCGQLITSDERYWVDVVSPSRINTLHDICHLAYHMTLESLGGYGCEHESFEIFEPLGLSVVA